MRKHNFIPLRKNLPINCKRYPGKKRANNKKWSEGKKILAPRLFKKQQHHCRHTAQDKPHAKRKKRSLHAQSQRQRCHHFDVAAAQGAAAQNGERSEYNKGS